MSAVALLPGEAIAPATSLPDAVSAGAVAELTIALGRAPTPGQLGSLVRRADGRTWLLSHRIPVLSRSDLGTFADRPWAHPVGMRFTTAYGPIAEVAAILLDPAGGDAEVGRRLALHEQVQREVHDRAEREKAEQRAVGAAEVQERRRVQKAWEDHDGASWGPLPVTAKLAFALALAVDDGLPLAEELRRLGRELARTSTLPFPGRRWR